MIDACEQGFALNHPDEETQFVMRLSRGIARAQTRRYDEAREDLQAVIHWMKGYEEGKDDEEFQTLFKLIPGWINTLSNKKNPFTPEVLEQLRNMFI
ncbi:MAG: hypothetical protein GY801_06350 [bacterium]|nr:hypothetical protein [bacterium]